MSELSNRLYAIQAHEARRNMDAFALPLNTDESLAVQNILLEISEARSLSQVRRVVREYVRFEANPAYQIIGTDGTLADRYIDRSGNLREERLQTTIHEVYPERSSEIFQDIVDNYDPETKIGNVKEIGIVPDLWLPNAKFSMDNFDFGIRIPYPRVAISAIHYDVSIYTMALIFAVIELGMAFVFMNSDDKLIRALIRVSGVFLVAWSFFGTEAFWAYILNFIFPEKNQLLQTQGSVMDFTAQHLELVIISSLITVPLGLFIGIMVTRNAFREFLPLATNIVNIGQTIPTLAIIALMVPIVGLGFAPALLALILYGLLPVVRNTIVGIEGVDKSIIDAAKGMGLTEAEILFQIELRIASRVIMAGIRTSVVINIGTATLGAFAGSGGLGVPISSGLSSFNNALVFLGAIPAAALAILADYILGRFEYVITPKGLQIES